MGYIFLLLIVWVYFEINLMFRKTTMFGLSDSEEIVTLTLLGRPCVVTGGLIIWSWYFFFFQRVISEISRPITLKLCHMVGNWSYFIIQLPKFGGSHPQKKFGGQKHAKFRSILHNLQLWSRISPEWLKISKIRKLMFPVRFLLRSQTRKLSKADKPAR